MSIICLRQIARFLAALLCCAVSYSLYAQSNVFIVLHSFAPNSGDPYYTNSDGVAPNSQISLSGNALYGTASQGCAPADGTAFSVSIVNSSFTNLHVFSALAPNSTNSDGATPTGSVIAGNTVYGTTEFGGSNGSGALFSVNINSYNFTNLHSFTAINPESGANSDGQSPAGVIISGNTLYGTTRYGGSNASGVIFRVDSDGSHFTNLYSFSADGSFEGESHPNNDGSEPVAGLLLSGNTLFGTANEGGINGNGAVFRINTDGSSFTNIHSFGTDGANPSAALVLAGATLFGTTSSGDIGGTGSVFRINTDSSGFTNLHNFTFADINGAYTNSDGAVPFALVLSGTTLFGVASQAGPASSGTLFRLNTDGLGFRILHAFTPLSGFNLTNNDGADPVGLIASGNTLYGTAVLGGAGGSGAVFSLTLAQAALKIAAAGNEAAITWPDWATNFVLETATNLSSQTWGSITNGITTVGTNFYFTTGITNQSAFFHLQPQ